MCEWLAWQRVERGLRAAPPVPPLRADFAARTAALVGLRQRVRPLPHWAQIAAWMGVVGLAGVIWGLALLPALGGVAYLLRALRILGAELVRYLLPVIGFWQAWKGALVLLALGLSLGIILWLLLPFLGACLSALVVYARRQDGQRGLARL